MERTLWHPKVDESKEEANCFVESFEIPLLFSRFGSPHLASVFLLPSCHWLGKKEGQTDRIIGSKNCPSVFGYFSLGPPTRTRGGHLPARFEEGNREWHAIGLVTSWFAIWIEMGFRPLRRPRFGPSGTAVGTKLRVVIEKLWDGQGVALHGGGKFRAQIIRGSPLNGLWFLGFGIEIAEVWC